MLCTIIIIITCFNRSGSLDVFAMKLFNDDAFYAGLYKPTYLIALYSCKMISLIISILFLVLPISTSGLSKITIDSLIITQVQDAELPSENSNAYVVTSTSSLEGFIVDTGFTSSTTSQLISAFQEQVRSITKSPKFVFVTHGHLDHVAGIALILQTYPSTKIYVISQQVITETVRFVNRRCAMVNFSLPSCTINYTAVMRVITSPRTQLSFNHPGVTINALSFIAKADSFYAGLLGLTTSSGFYFLFTGDAITIKSHLYPNNFFDTSGLPGIDDALCAWAGTMQASACDLQLGNRRPMIMPGHGPVSDVSSYVKDIAQSVAWLRTLRRLTFNSCNATYIWAEMIRQYPDFGETQSITIGALNNHVPTDANSVNCNCSNGSPTICPVYNAPPTCIHLDINDSDTTLACNMLTSPYSTASKSLYIPPFILLLSFIILTNLNYD